MPAQQPIRGGTCENMAACENLGASVVTCTVSRIESLGIPSCKEALGAGKLLHEKHRSIIDEDRVLWTALAVLKVLFKC